jgi:hypothetical protein
LEDGIQVTLKFKNIYHVIKEVFCWIEIDIRFTRTF